MSRLILVRHGQTESNVHGLLDSAVPGGPLTPLGREQAAALPGRFAQERITRVVASPLTRAVQTATPLADALGLELPTDAGLREISAGDLEMRSDRPSVLTFVETVLAWGAGDLAARVPGSSESGTDFLARYDRAVEAALRDAGGTVVLLSHGAAIRTWAAARAVNVDARYAADHGLPNTGAVLLERAGAGAGAWTVLGWQDVEVPDAPADPTGAPVEP